MNPIYNLPNLLTVLRIALIPVFILLFYLPTPWAREAATAVFVLAAATDWLDGYLARRMQLVTALGAFLDPVADKLMVATALVLVVQADTAIAMAVSASVIIGREITISALREWMAGIGDRTKVAVSEVGKFKTAVQMTAISLLVYRNDLWGIPIYQFGQLLLYVAVLLTLWSMTVYLRAAWPSLRGGATAQQRPGEP